MKYLFYIVDDTYESYVCAIDLFNRNLYSLEMDSSISRIICSDPDSSFLVDSYYITKFIKFGNDLGFIYEYREQIHSL